MTGQNPSAGSAEPYWFEWETGLLPLVELLDDDSEITAVAFQLQGTKGWDDVGIKLRAGPIRLLQMKHSRTGGRLTFGDLVGRDAPTQGQEPSASLLTTLALAWLEERTHRGGVECVLVTNQGAGTNWRENRPPLEEFSTKLKQKAANAITLTEITWEEEDNLDDKKRERYSEAWKLFRAELSNLTDENALDFIRALTIQVDAPDADRLEDLIRDRLATLTGLPLGFTNNLFNALLAGLRKWTSQTRREQEWITREDLLFYMAGEEQEPSWIGHCEVETPEPFLPSRLDLVDALRGSLSSNDQHKVDFLFAEPGTGKTSCISKLARDGALHWKDQAVSVRFYAYLPLRPDRKDVSGDFNLGVTPGVLWLSLLWQIRVGLRKTSLLSELKVPVWIQGMPWEMARTHVLRIAEALAVRWARDFVICVDGIDHAARARRSGLPEFLQTLPAPDTVPPQVRFLLAGQPPDAYPEYPVFLRQSHPLVKRHEISPLLDKDIEALWRSKKGSTFRSPDDAAVRLLASKGQRRTLPTVYAVEDIRLCSTIEEAQLLLDSRPLADSLHSYYDAIWSSATQDVSEGTHLIAVFALLRERPTGDILASALGRTTLEWTAILRRLRPLVRETPYGFELVHNDLRVHLDSRLSTEAFVLREVSLALAQHYRKKSSNRSAAHDSLLDLLKTGGAENSFATDFSSEWVIEAGALSKTDELSDQCIAAYKGAVAERNWKLLHSVACASLTFHRLIECFNNSSATVPELNEKPEPPPFFSVESEPKALELWERGDLAELAFACTRLLDHGDIQRATLIIRQWLGPISIEQLVAQLATGGANNSYENAEAKYLDDRFEQFGTVLARCFYAPKRNKPDSKLEHGIVAFEKGWVRGLAGLSNRKMALRLWVACAPMARDSWILAVRGAAKALRWGEVRSLLNRLEKKHAKLPPDVLHEFGWYAARAKPRNIALWEQPLKLRNFGLTGTNQSLEPLLLIAQWATYVDPVREPSQVADELLKFVDDRRFRRGHFPMASLILRAKGFEGRLLRYIDRGDFTAAGQAVPWRYLAPLVEGLWCKAPNVHDMPAEDIRLPRRAGAELVAVIARAGVTFRDSICERARLLFNNAMLLEDGPDLFDILVACGEDDLLRRSVSAKAQELIAGLHEKEVSWRSEIVGRLLGYLRHLELSDLADALLKRYRVTKLGYSTHEDWIFEPLIRWFDLRRKHSPETWKTQGCQLLALDELCERQEGDNNYQETLMAQLGAAAIACGALHFEVLLARLANRDVRSSIWNLMKAAREGLRICLQEGRMTEDEDILAGLAIVVALGRWPVESPTQTIEAVTAKIPETPPGRWDRIRRIAADIQGVDYVATIASPAPAVSAALDEPLSAEEILDQLVNPVRFGKSFLSVFANLAEAIVSRSEGERSEMINKALVALAGSEAFARHMEFTDKRLAQRLYQNLKEDERWRLLSELTRIVELRADLTDPKWAHSVSFAVVDLFCLARASTDQVWGNEIFDQLIEMHWRWHGLPAPAVPAPTVVPSDSWRACARRILLSLTRTDSCETLYMTMCGIRVLTELFPDQIAEFCREGLTEETSKEPILTLCQLWATRYPEEISAIEPRLADFQTHGSLDERLEAWLVDALEKKIRGIRLSDFAVNFNTTIPPAELKQEPPPFEMESHNNGLMRHNSFVTMTTLRINRVGRVIGGDHVAMKYMAHAINRETFTGPDYELKAPSRLAMDGNYPRPRMRGEHVAGDAVMYQCRARKLQPHQTAIIRLMLGYGMDPWIVSSFPKIWSDEASWPQDFDVERWYGEERASKSSDIWHLFTALLSGADLDPSEMVLGAQLDIPTFRRDIQFQYWLTSESVLEGRAKPAKAPSGRTFSGFLLDWAPSGSSRPVPSSVRFAGSLLNFPNSDLNIVPTSDWIARWNWKSNPRNALSLISDSGEIVARYERFLGSDNIGSGRPHRLPLLSRWVAKKNSLPQEIREMVGWRVETEFLAKELNEYE